MTSLQLASLFNVTSAAAVMVVSISVAWRHQAPFFRRWLYAHGALVVALGLNWLNAQMGHWPALSIVTILALIGCSLCLVASGLALRDNSFARGFYWLLALAGGLSLWMVWVLPYKLAMVPVLFGLSIGYLFLANSLFVCRRHFSPYARRWLGLPFMLSGILPLIFPVVGGTPSAVFAHLLAGVLSIMVGLGMVVFLLEESVSGQAETNAELARSAAQLQRQNEELKELDRLKTSFLGTMSHELRTPLTGIRLAAAMVQLSFEETQEEQRYLRMIDQHVEQLTRLINDVLDLTRIESGHLSVMKDEEELGRLVRAAAEGAQLAFEQKGISLSCHIPEVELHAMFDFGRLHQVLDNLLGNALKFTPPGGRVEIVLEPMPQMACIRVSDTGIGIAAEYHERIFQKFFQIDGSSTRAYGGAGLGLAICKAIVEEGHGGRMWVESRPGEGASFCLAVPKLA